MGFLGLGFQVSRFPRLCGTCEGASRGYTGFIGSRVLGLGFRVSQKLGYRFGGPYNKDYNMLWCTLFSYFGKLQITQGYVRFRLCTLGNCR